MSASINNVINVTLLEEGRAAARDNINVCAILTSQTGVLSTAERWRSYKSAPAVEQDWGLLRSPLLLRMCFSGPVLTRYPRAVR